MLFKKIVLFCIFLNIINVDSIDLNIIKIIQQNLLNRKNQKIESNCDSDLNYAIQSLPETWALQFLDSAGRLPTGISEGNLKSFGQFDMCIGINHFNSTNDRNIQGKYCLAKVAIDTILGGGNLTNDLENNYKKNSIASRLPGVNLDFLEGYTFNFGFCIPKTCNENDIQNFLSNYPLDIKISDNDCSTSDSLPITAADWCAISLLIIMGILLFTSTTYDFFMYYTKNERYKHHNILVSFSLKTNTERLFKINSSPSSLKCIHGIRALSMFWVILGHRYFVVLQYPLWSFTDIIKWIDQYPSMIILGATVSVDTFFLISGLLLSYIFFKQMEKAKSFNLIMFYVHRHLRLTPAFAAIILFQATLYKHLGNGPIYHTMLKQPIENCQKYWWPALLYVQNYVHPNNMCLLQSWYLAVDMQLYYISPLILYPLYKSRRFGLINLSIWILVFMIILLTIIYSNNWSGALIPFAPGSARKLLDYYIVTHMRAIPWFLGIASGYGIYNSTKKDIRINKVLVTFLWIVSFIVMGAVVFGLFPLQNPIHVPNKLEDGTYDSFHRISWSLAMAWIIFACIHGYGGPINWILSMDVWQIIGRMSYSMYLVHLSIQYWQTSLMRVVPNFSHVTMVYNYFGDIFFTIAIAYCITMMFESPILVLEKMIFRENKTKQLDKMNLSTTPNNLKNSNVVLVKMDK